MNANFFESALNAGAILTGFCGTFLVFRIEREAGFFRAPGWNDKDKRAIVLEYNLQHFTWSFWTYKRVARNGSCNSNTSVSSCWQVYRNTSATSFPTIGVAAATYSSGLEKYRTDQLAGSGTLLPAMKKALEDISGKAAPYVR